MDTLQEIITTKERYVRECAQRMPLPQLQRDAERADEPRGFVAALSDRIGRGGVAVIAEIKKASPSKGLLRKDFHPDRIARSYEAGGAACLSVLTDMPFFQGCDADLQCARSACSLPVLRKDFVIDAYQVFEARALGADAILLIVAALDHPRLRALHVLGRALGMDVLVEVHNAQELDRALAVGPTLVGINNRDLRTFETRIETAIELCSQIPNGCTAVAESGILTPRDVERLADAGVRAFLVGEALMRADDPGIRIGQLFGGYL